MSVLSRISRAIRRPSQRAPVTVKPLNDFYLRNKLLTLSVGVVLTFSLHPVLSFPLILAAYALTYPSKRATEANLLMQDPEPGLKPIYNGRRFGAVAGALLVGTGVGAVGIMDQAHIKGEMEVADYVNKAGEVKMLEYKIPIKDPLFKDPIKFRVSTTLFGQRYSIVPHSEYDEVTGTYTVRFKPTGTKIKLYVLNGDEVLDVYEYPPSKTEET